MGAVLTPLLGIAIIFFGYRHYKRKQSEDPETTVVVLRPVEQALAIRDLNRLVSALDQVRAPYDSSNRRHEAMLAQLWTLLKPGVPRAERFTPLWKDIGFQGTDPATDFRGMGLLGLQNLVHFAERFPRQAAAVLEDSQKDNWFSFAITGLNITADMCHLTKERKLNNYFYTAGSSLPSFNALYAYLFCRLNERWREINPDTVMVFQEVRRKFLDEVVEDDRKGRLSHLVQAIQM